jgi:hypothetical protein
MNKRGELKIWKRIRRLFVDEERTDAAARRNSLQPPTVASAPIVAGSHLPAFLDDDAVKFRIEAVLAQRPPEACLVGGKVNLLNLGKLKERLGAKWPRYEEQVHEFVAKTLERRLSDKDFFTRSGEGSYVILFHDVSETEAKLKCALLGQEISNRFFGHLGDDDGQGLQLDTVLASVDGGVARESISLADAIRTALAEAEAEAEAKAAEKEGRRAGALTPAEIEGLLGARFAELDKSGDASQPPKLVQDRFRELIRQLKNIEDALAADTQNETRLTGKTGHRQDVPHPSEDPKAGLRAIFREIIERADQAIQESEASDADLADDEDGASLALETSYQPIWSAKHESIGLYRCHTRIVYGSADVGVGTNSDDDVQTKVVGAVDRITLRRARKDLQQLASSGLACFIVIPVNFNTLNRPASAHRYLLICHAIPKELRHMVIWEIQGAPLLKWTTNFARIVAQLKPLGRAVFILSRVADLPLPSLHRIFGNLQSMRVHGVGLELTGHAATEEEIIKYLGLFAAVAEKRKLMCYVNGVSSLSVSTAASCSGFEHLSGQIIAESIKKPQGVRHKELISLYSPVAVENAL